MIHRHVSRSGKGLGLNRLAAVVAAGSLGLAGMASAAELIAYEGFDYTTGTALTSQSGGSGWSNDWYLTNSSSQVSPTVVSDGLTFGDLQVSGRAITMDNASANSSIAFRGAGTFNSGEVWVSFLARPVTEDAASAFFGVSFYNGNDSTVTSSIQRKTVGTGVLPWALTAGTVTSPDTKVNMVIGHTYLLVARFEFSDEDTTPDRLTLYIDPTPGQPLPAAPDLTIEAGSGANLHWDRLRLGSSGSRDWIVDELRIGATYESVTPVPEPATGMLTAPLLAGLCVRRRR